MVGPRELLRLDIPARPAFAGVARSAVAAVMTGCEGLDDERREDLRQAVAEAWESLPYGSGDGRVVLLCRRSGDHLEVAVEGPGDLSPVVCRVALAGGHA